MFMLTRWALSVVLAASLTPTQVSKSWPFDGQEAAKRQAETAKAFGVPKQLTVDLGNGVPLKLILIPAGKFMMGSPETETIDLPTPGTHRANESPLHEVTITRPFFLSVYKVTQEQYERVMGANPSKFAGKDHPVDAITWDDAVLFCQKASARTKRKVHLPTEAQWEYAARAGTNTRFSFGDDETKIGDYAWFHDNAKGQTYPVGQKLPNAWGLFDVHGLLWEYTSDFYSTSYAEAASTDPRGQPPEPPTRPEEALTGADRRLCVPRSESRVLLPMQAKTSLATSGSASP